MRKMMPCSHGTVLIYFMNSKDRYSAVTENPEQNRARITYPEKTTVAENPAMKTGEDL